MFRFFFVAFAGYLHIYLFVISCRLSSCKAISMKLKTLVSGKNKKQIFQNVVC